MELILLLVVYASIYAGILLGSWCAEEIIVGEKRLKILRNIIAILLFVSSIVVSVAVQNYFIILFGVLFIIAEFVNLRLVIRFALLGLLCALSPDLLILGFAALYNLVQGSMFVRPYVKDRWVVPASPAYVDGFRETWTFIAVAVLVILVKLAF